MQLEGGRGIPEEQALCQACQEPAEGPHLEGAGGGEGGDVSAFVFI